VTYRTVPLMSNPELFKTTPFSIFVDRFKI